MRFSLDAYELGREYGELEGCANPREAAATLKACDLLATAANIEAFCAGAESGSNVERARRMSGCDPDYGGAFDGFTVTSDADPGL